MATGMGIFEPKRWRISPWGFHAASRNTVSPYLLLLPSLGLHCALLEYDWRERHERMKKNEKKRGVMQVESTATFCDCPFYPFLSLLERLVIASASCNRLILSFPLHYLNRDLQMSNIKKKKLTNALVSRKFFERAQTAAAYSVACPDTETSSWTWWVAKATLHGTPQAIRLSFQIAKDRSVRSFTNKHCLAFPPSRVLHLHSPLLMDDKIAIHGDFNLESTALEATTHPLLFLCFTTLEIRSCGASDTVPSDASITLLGKNKNMGYSG